MQVFTKVRCILKSLHWLDHKFVKMQLLTRCVSIKYHQTKTNFNDQFQLIYYDNQDNINETINLRLTESKQVHRYYDKIVSLEEILIK